MLYSFEKFLDDRFTNEKTKKGYAKNVADFLAYIDAEEIETIEMKPLDIKKYIFFLKEQGLSNHTIARKNSAIRLYLKYLRSQGLMKHNPFEDIKQPELRKTAKPLAATEAYALEDIMKQRSKWRDLILFRLCYVEKIKVSKIIHFKTDDVNVEQGMIFFNQQAFLIGKETLELLRAYIEEKSSPSDYLLVSGRNAKLSESGAYFILKTYFKEIGREDLRPIDLHAALQNK